MHFAWNNLPQFFSGFKLSYILRLHRVISDWLEIRRLWGAYHLLHDPSFFLFLSSLAVCLGWCHAAE